jgi:hypothetical protein
MRAHLDRPGGQRTSRPQVACLSRWVEIRNGRILWVTRRAYLATPVAHSLNTPSLTLSKGWPIAGVPPYLTKPPCLTLPVNKQFTDVRHGPLRLRFFYGDGANHVGLCRVFLINPKDPASKTGIGEMMDCARSDHPAPWTGIWSLLRTSKRGPRMIAPAASWRGEHGRSCASFQSRI